MKNISLFISEVGYSKCDKCNRPSVDLEIFQVDQVIIRFLCSHCMEVMR